MNLALTYKCDLVGAVDASLVVVQLHHYINLFLSQRRWHAACCKKKSEIKLCLGQCFF